MINHGWLGLDRAWCLSPESPFAPKKRRGHYIVWQTLALGAAYEPMPGLEIGEVRTTTRELADLCVTTHTSIIRALDWLSETGLVTVLSSRKGLHLRLNKFDLLHSMRAFLSLENTANKSYPQAPVPNSSVYTSALSDGNNQEKSCIKNEQNFTRSKLILPVPKVFQTKQPLSQGNNTEKHAFENAPVPNSFQNCDILNNKETIHTNYSDKSPPLPAVASGDEPSDFDFEIAKAWLAKTDADKKAKAVESHRIYKPSRAVLKKWAASITALREKDKLSESDIRKILHTRFTDDFYRTVPMCPPGLRRRSENGKRKWENILAKAIRNEGEARPVQPQGEAVRLPSGNLRMPDGTVIVMPGSTDDD